MKYTEKQIENAKKAYNSMMVLQTIKDYDVNSLGWVVANQRLEFHNKIVNRVINGCEETIKEWKLFFLNEEVKRDAKQGESKAKLQANKDASADVLASVKSLKKLGEFGKWLNTSGNPFTKEHFSKKYTNEYVTAFLATI